MGAIRGKISDVSSDVPSEGLSHKNVVALHAVGRKVMMTEGLGWGHAHSRYIYHPLPGESQVWASSMLVCNWLGSILGYPIASNGASS